ncbi:MAG: hypothetical protein RL226_1209 [Bacteroidota bacterium]|jgi:hypothetical protein
MSEHKEYTRLKRLAENARKDFTVPENYFETLKQNALLQFPQGEFQIPEGYFQQLEQNLGVDTSIPPVPADYFDVLESKVLMHIDKPNRSSNIRPLIWAVSIAASLVIAFLWQRNAAKEECISFTCLLQQTQLTEDELLELYDHQVLGDLIQTTQVENTTEVDDDPYLEYLIESDESIEILIDYE